MCGLVPGIHVPGIHVPGISAFGAEPSRGWPGTEGRLRPSSRAMPGHDAAAMTLQRCFHMIGTRPLNSPTFGRPHGDASDRRTICIAIHGALGSANARGPIGP